MRNTIRSAPRRALPLAAAALILGASAAAAQTDAVPPCPAEQHAAFAFLAGRWAGIVFDLHGTDSTAGASVAVEATPVLSGCALHERWHFEEHGVTEVDDEVLRAYDAASGLWAYDIVTSRLEHVRFEGRRLPEGWAFERDFPGAKPARVRIMWVPTSFGYTERIWRSTDGGTTWTETRHIDFTKVSD